MELSADSGTSELERFRNLLYEIKESLDYRPAQPFYLDDVFMQRCDFPKENAWQARIIREQKKLLGKDKGFELRGSLVSSNLSSDQDEDGSSETGQGHIELSWDILKGGLLQNNAKTESLELLAKVTELKTARQELKRQFRCIFHRIRKDFTNLYMQTLSLKLKLMEPVYRIERRAYFKQWSFLDDYLVSEADLTLARQEMRSLLSDPYYDAVFFPSFPPPVITVDLQELLKNVRNDNSVSAIYKLEKVRIEKEADAVFHDSLRIYLRKEFDKEDGFGEAEDFTAGLRLKIPLQKRKTDLPRLKLRQLEQQTRYDLWERLSRCRSSHDLLKEQLRRTIAQHYRHERAKERLRHTLFLLDNTDEQLMTTAITRMKSLIDARLELIKAHEELYLRICLLFEAAEIPYQSDLLLNALPVKELERARIGTRSIYIWSHDFNRLDNRDIKAFLEAKQITAVFLSSGGSLSPGKRDEFISLLDRNGIRTELIIGENNWIFKNKQKRAVEKILITAEKTGNVHLDIEPQALSEYSKKRQEYIDRFLELIRLVRNGLLDRELSVAVPFHWSAHVYSALAEYSDRLFIMAYGTSDPALLVRRISPAIAGAGPLKLAVVLRPQDFKDEWEMEKMIDHIHTQTGINTFGFHDLGRFLTLTASSNETEN